MLRRPLIAATGTFCALISGFVLMPAGRLSAQVVTQAPQMRGMPRDQPPSERKGTPALRGRVTALDTGRPLRR